MKSRITKRRDKSWIVQFQTSAGRPWTDLRHEDGDPKRQQMRFETEEAANAARLDAIRQALTHGDAA